MVGHHHRHNTFCFVEILSKLCLLEKRFHLMEDQFLYFHHVAWQRHYYSCLQNLSEVYNSINSYRCKFKIMSFSFSCWRKLGFDFVSFLIIEIIPSWIFCPNFILSMKETTSLNLLMIVSKNPYLPSDNKDGNPRIDCWNENFYHYFKSIVQNRKCLFGPHTFTCVIAWNKLNS